MSGRVDMTIYKLFRTSIQVSSRVRRLLQLLAGTYIICLVAGYVLLDMRVPFALSLRDMLYASVSTAAPFTTVLETLESGNLVLAIALTFLVNLSSGAFMSTTLPGVVPLLGAVGTLGVTVSRGLIIGMAYHDVLTLSPLTATLAAGTAILELGAYVFSGAAGMNISLSFIYPSKYGTESRIQAFKEAWRDAARIYVIVVMLLALGAVWEMTGLYLALRR